MNTVDLIREIESKDRRFRRTLGVFMTLVVIGAIIGGYMAAQAYQERQAQAERERSEVLKLIDQKLQAISDQNKCIVEFFTQPDRDNLVIESADNCFQTDEVAGEEPAAGGTISPSGSGSRRTAIPQGTQTQSSSNQNPGNSNPPVVTPPDEPNTLDERGVRRCVVQLLPGGADPCALQ